MEKNFTTTWLISAPRDLAIRRTKPRSATNSQCCLNSSPGASRSICRPDGRKAKPSSCGTPSIDNAARYYRSRLPLGAFACYPRAAACWRHARSHGRAVCENRQLTEAGKTIQGRCKPAISPASTRSYAGTAASRQSQWTSELARTTNRIGSSRGDAAMHLGRPNGADPSAHA